MCWSLPASVTFGAVALGVAAWRHRAGDIRGKVNFFLYFALMEAIQTASYFVGLGRCDSVANQVLTAMSWVHIAWQPLVVNEYFLGIEGDVHPEVSRLIRGLCVVAGAGLTARLAVPGNPVAALGSYLNRDAVPVTSDAGFVPFGPNHPGFSFPELPPAAAAATGSHCGYEAMCGTRLCTFAGVRHLAWSVPLLPSTYFLPSGYAHFLLFFCPAIFAPGSKIVVRRVLAVGAMAIGPLLSMAFSSSGASGFGGRSEESDVALPNVGNSYAHTWPAWWCFMSAAQALLILAGDLFCRDKNAESERVRVARAAAGKGAASSKKNLSVLASSASVPEQEYDVVLSPGPAKSGGRAGTRRRAKR